MVAIDDVHRQRWTALKPESEIGLYVPNNAIPAFFRAHPELGSPIGPEQDLDGGGRVQAFAGGVVTWTPQGGAQLAQG